jgi:TetR/AcrR family transcriptional regulator, repressor for uid operon
VGRLPSTTSAETRARIVGAARKCFGRFGYEKTTNKDIASEAGITAGAIYHHFDSKPDLFAAVVQESNAFIFGAFREAAAPEDAFVDKVNAILRTAVRLHQRDPTLAAFAATSAIELQRHPEGARAAGADPGGGLGFFAELVAGAADRGELAADVSRHAVANMLIATTMGLAQFAALVDSVKVHRDAMEAFIRLMEGSLFERPPFVPRRRRPDVPGTRAGRRPGRPPASA